MITIAEPKEYVNRLWGKQKVQEESAYRLMRYVLRFDHEAKVLLHNVVTGQLVLLEQDEAKLLDQFPVKYCAAMDQLIEGHYLVPEGFDEHQRVAKLREVLILMDNARAKPGIIQYTILPTTACNARCYYCYQHYLKPVVMSEQTANDVVEFIQKQCEGNKVWIRWFGGEPTLAIDRISQICKGLRDRSIEFESSITTNGYQMDEKSISTMKSEWNLEEAMISLDGSEENYNKTKAFVGVQDNPYQRVLRNVGLLLDHGVRALLRMNFNNQNYWDFSNLLEDVDKRYKEHKNRSLLEVHAHYILPDYPDADESFFANCEQWYSEKSAELDDLSREKGFFHDAYQLPSLEYKLCIAARDSTVVIMPDGSLASCPDLLGSEQVKGNVREGIVDKEKALSWKRLSDVEHCRACPLFPRCAIVSNCKGKEICYHKTAYLRQYEAAALRLLNTYSKSKPNNNGGNQNG